MTQSNAAQISNITEFAPQSDSLIDSLASMNSDDYHHYIRQIAHGLYAEVNVIFPQEFKIVYLVAKFSERSIWHAYLSKTYCDPDHPRKITNVKSIRQKLLYQDSKSLLMEAFGALPNGFVGAIGRLPQQAQPYKLYTLLHSQMTQSKDFRTAYAHTATLNPKIIETVSSLPKVFQNFELAKQLQSPEDIKNLLFAVNTLARGDSQKYKELCEMVVTAASRNHSISAVLKRYYYLTPFPDAVVPGTEFCKHISNAFELQKAAKQFQNCLKDYCEEGIRGEYQYYRWYEAGKVTAIISLREDAPFGFRIYEIQGKRNEYIDDDLEQKIIKHFEKHDVYKMSSMEALLRELGMLNRGRGANPAEDISLFIDELLDDGPT